MQPFVLLPATGTDPADEWIKLAVEMHAVGKFPDAERHYRRALTLSPNNATATHNLAILLSQTGHLPEAVLAMERAALFDGVQPLLHANRAMMYLEVERLEDALAAAEYAVGLAKDKPKMADALAVQSYLSARLAYCMIAATSGYPDKAMSKYREMLEIDPKHPAAGPNSCFVQSLMAVGPEELLKQRRAWYEANKFTGAVWPHGNSKETERTLRVGYVGGDFKCHSAAMMYANVLLQHTPAVQAYFYSSLPVDYTADPMTARFMLAAGHIRENPDDGPELLTTDGSSRWRDIVGKSDEDVDNLIRNDRIDILVDLAGHTNGGRLGVFCRRPAPVQVTAWGFAHGTGVPVIDYFFADPVAIPESERCHYAERIYDLPCIVTYRPPLEYGVRESTPVPYFANERFTFGSFSRFEKLSDECLATFAGILRRVPDSRMMFKDHAMKRPYSIKRIRAAMPDIDPARITFGNSTIHADHLHYYQGCDLYLDTWPHGAGVVSLECLFAGVPLLTRYGTQAAGRTAASVLTQMGRTDWITYSADEFVERAVSLAADPAALGKARKTLRSELLGSKVVNGYTEAVERAYAAMWKEWCTK